ncbi:iron uptake porin [Kamptonema cortianum]|uniref:Iron uptake porin n=1 Tax=Geitlerinema calcuttense NRMC-F 0142 TaxID=2922238 RepID=A0ABT7LWH9_9CYAN|nr:iron uptake porin [Geitlerinema calcuttense]MDK3157246.1 iron uptake porin [Kamptonema cortianum]MDL5056377.1 iron uptake porin [Geitlerinema calcuttense NRMC-F 0142]
MPTLWRSALHLVSFFVLAQWMGLTAAVAETPLPLSTEAQAAPSETPIPLADSRLNSLDQILHYSNERLPNNPSIGQVTSISQLRDVQPTDWAFQSLQSLVERYGCIAGYPDGTYRGNRAMTRFEFAAGVNACLDRINELIAAATANALTREDLLVIQRLQEEFAAELATLRGRVDALEARTAELEANQFSTTTKLFGEVDFGIVDSFGRSQDTNTTLGGRAILSLDTSFTGRDLLRTKFEAGNFVNFTRDITGTDMTAHDFGTNASTFFISSLFYRFPIGSRSTAYIIPVGLAAHDMTATLSPVTAAQSAFAQRNPIYRQSDGGGAGVDFRFSDAVSLTLAYHGPPSSISNPLPGQGLFNGYHAAFGQLTFLPSDRFGLALTYIRYYSPGPNEPGQINLTGGTGSQFAQAPFGDETATSAHSVGIQSSFRLTRGMVLGGWAGYSRARAETSPGFGVSRGDTADVWNWAVGLAFPDLGRAGNELGFMFGMPPRAAGNDVRNRVDRDVSYHIEAFYRLHITDNIWIAPAAYVILNPEHNNNNDPIYMGLVRTHFNF